MMYYSGVIFEMSGAKDTLFNGAGTMLDWHDIEMGILINNTITSIALHHHPPPASSVSLHYRTVTLIQ